MEGHNLILLGLYSMDFMLAKPSNALVCVPGVKPNLPELPREIASCVLESLECLAFIQLMRGIPDEATVSADLFYTLAQRNASCYGNDLESRSQLTRAHTLNSIVVLAS